MSWNQRSLGALLEKSGSQRAGKKEYPVLSITMKHGLVDQSEKFKKRIASQDATTYRVAYKNELVVGFPIDEGVLGFQTIYPAGIVSPAYDIWKLKDEANTHIPFLERYLRSPQARRIYASKMQGAVARRRSLTKNDFLNLEIPFPPIDDQIRIAHLLSKVEGLIDKRKESLQQLDELLKSVFLEMFGDPVLNEKGWELRPCDKMVTDIQSGTSYGGQEKECLDDDEYGVLKISAVTQGYFNPNEFKAVKKTAITKELRFVKKGDLLFSRANTIELVAACCMVEKDSNSLFLPDKLWALTLNETINIQYFNYLLKNKSFRNLVRKQASGGHDSMLNISMKKFRSLNIPVPNRDLQNQFAAIVEKIEGIKARYQQILSELENLFDALSQKVFKGELDLSRVSLSAVTDPSESDQLQRDKRVNPNLNDIKTSAAKSSNNISNPAPFTNKSFEEFLSARKDKVLTAAALWQELKQVNIENQPPNFESFKNLVMDYLDEGRWLEQVYAEVPVDNDVDGSKVEKFKEKKVALRIRDDS